MIVDEHRAAFDRDGLVLLRGLVRPDWITRLRAAVPALLPPATGPQFHNVADTHRRDPTIRAFVDGSLVAAAAADLLGAAQIALYADVLLVKAPGATARTPWHHDLPFWPFRGRALSAWVALDEVDERNGALEYIAGSHRWGRWFKPAGVPAAPLPEGDAEDMPIDPAAGHEMVRPSLSPGDVLFHHPLVVHGAGGNAGSASRRALSLRLVADGSRYTGRALFNTRPSPLTTGDPIERDPAYPVVWRRSS